MAEGRTKGMVSVDESRRETAEEEHGQVTNLLGVFRKLPALIRPNGVKGHILTDDLTNHILAFSPGFLSGAMISFQYVSGRASTAFLTPLSPKTGVPMRVPDGSAPEFANVPTGGFGD